jgi:nicotinate-nucleotide adenylyltransferase
MRIGIFGGTFDPVHYGHLLLAECCREQCQLDEVWLIPAWQSPHKQTGAAARPEHRLEMLRLAVAGNPQFRVSMLEIERGAVSYTVDTLAEIQRQRPDDTLFLLLGADSMADFPQWREPERIRQLATLVVVDRPGHEPPPANQPSQCAVEGQPASAPSSGRDSTPALRVEMPQLDHSSTELRRRAHDGRSLRYRTPRAVQRYIETHRIYPAANDGTTGATEPDR